MKNGVGGLDLKNVHWSSPKKGMLDHWKTFLPLPVGAGIGTVHVGKMSVVKFLTSSGLEIKVSHT